MIKSFGDKQTERLFNDAPVRRFQGIARRAKRKLESIQAAARLEDLTVPPSNRLGAPEGVPFNPDQRSMARDFQMDGQRCA